MSHQPACRPTPLCVRQGSDELVDIEVATAGVPFDLTDWELVFLVKEAAQRDDVDALFVYTTDGVSPRIVITDEAAGLGEIRFDPTDIADADTWWFRLDGVHPVEAPTGRVLAFGPFEVTDT